MSERPWTRDELIHHEAHDVIPPGAKPEDCQMCALLSPKSRYGFHCGADYVPQSQDVVSSCDSELAAIRRFLSSGDVVEGFELDTAQRLLRMVDELTKERDEAYSLARRAGAETIRLTGERDELRTKLAEAEKRIEKAQSITAMVEHNLGLASEKKSE
jgi:hypothetical protein